MAVMPVEIVKSGKLSGVLARLGLRRHPHAGELESRVGDQLRSSAWLPTLPVPIWRDSDGHGWSSQVGDGKVEVGNGEAAVDLECLAGQVAARG